MTRYLIAENDIVIMLGLGSLKDKISNLGEGLKSQFSFEVEAVEVESNPGAGASLLTHYQDCWRILHNRGVAAAKEAERCDRKVKRASVGIYSIMIWIFKYLYLLSTLKLSVFLVTSIRTDLSVFLSSKNNLFYHQDCGKNRGGV